MVEVLHIVGTGDPFDVVFMMPLVSQWRAVRACGLEGPEPLPIDCDAPIARILTLSEPGLVDDNGNAHHTLAMCEGHFQSWRAAQPVAVGH